MEQKLGEPLESECSLGDQSYPHGFEKCEGSECKMCSDGKWIDAERPARTD
jgi:hypothetical protein